MGAGPQRLPGKSVQVISSKEDSMVKDLLKKSGIDFETVDLSRGLRTRISARLQHVSETPTLIVENNPPKRYEGVKAITQYLVETRAKT